MPRSGIKRMNVALVALCASVGLATLIHAQGGPPMITDDPGTPGPGNWEINIAFTGSDGASGAQAETPLIDINYGVGERVQLKYEVPWVTRHDPGGETRSGLGNSLLGIKWRFHDSAGGRWRVSAYPQIELRNPGSSSARRGLVEDGTGVLLPFEFERSFSNIGVDLEFGREFRSRDGDAWFGGIVVGTDVSGSVELMAELHGERQLSTHEYRLAANLGARFAVNRFGTLLVSAGRDMHCLPEERNSLFVYVGWQVLREK